MYVSTKRHLGQGNHGRVYGIHQVKRESRHIKTQDRQILKYKQLCHRNAGGCSSHLHGDHGDHDQKQHETAVSESSALTTTTTATGPDPQKVKWAINISSKPLITELESLLACGPNFAVVPRGPHC